MGSINNYNCTLNSKLVSLRIIISHESYQWYFLKIHVQFQTSNSGNTTSPGILTRVSNLFASLGHTGRRVVLAHIFNTLWQVITHTHKSHNILSKFTILCWAALIAIQGHMWLAVCGLDTPALRPILLLPMAQPVYGHLAISDGLGGGAEHQDHHRWGTVAPKENKNEER